MATAPDIVVVYVMRRHTGPWQTLQLRRRPGGYLADTWQFAGGKIDPGETAVQAARRELREETGLAADEMRHLTFVPTFYMPKIDRVTCAAAFCVFAGADWEPTLDVEHTAWRWIGRGEVRGKVMWPTDRQALAEVWREHLPGRRGIADPHRIV